MTVYRGPTVTISGNIMLKDYKKGFILIRIVNVDPREAALDHWRNQDIIARQKLLKPGAYEIKVPRKIGKVYILASNLDTQDKAEILTAASSLIEESEYPNNPVNVGTQDIRGIDIEITAK
jgi:hypothetical protein